MSGHASLVARGFFKGGQKEGARVRAGPTGSLMDVANYKPCSSGICDNGPSEREELFSRYAAVVRARCVVDNMGNARRLCHQFQNKSEATALS